MTWSQGNLHFFWFTAGGKPAVYRTVSEDQGAHFEERKQVNTDARHPQVSSLEDGSIGAVWEQSFGEGDESYNRIVLEVINPDGIGTQYNISQKGMQASFPVILGLDGSFLVAWTQQESGSKRVYYKLVKPDSTVPMP